MAHLSLYRKYRSQTFADLVGQGHVVRTLQNAITSGRAAHAYLFTGPRGTGKTSSARLLAKALCCDNGPTAEPCNECDQCVAITQGSHLDVYEMDAASDAGVDDVRDRIVDTADYKPTMARRKVFIIDEVHDLSPKAFDALLKTIEEPPEHLTFILATTELGKVPATIRSRCQTFQFHRGSVQDLIQRLEYVAGAEGVEAEPAALGAIARMADGAFRDALTLLEQAIVTADGPVTLQHVYDQLGLIPDELVDALLGAIHKADMPQIFELSDRVARMGRDPRALLESLEYRLADLTRAIYGVDQGGPKDGAREAVLHEAAARLGKDFLLRLRGEIAEAHRAIRDVSLPRLWLEAQLVRLSQAPAPAATTPLPKTEAPRAVPPPARNPTPESQRPKQEAAVPEKPAPKRVAAPQPTGDVATDLWNRAKASLSGMSKTMAIRLEFTRARKGADNELIVEFDRQMDLEWVTESIKRQSAVVEQIQANGGQDWKATFVAGSRTAIVERAEAVELPAEGQRLEQLARDILGAT